MLKKMEPRPAMFTGEVTLKSIQTCISGYYHALFDYKIIEGPLAIDPFHDWIAHKLGYYESTAGWVNMINAYSLGFKPANINWNVFLETSITEQQHLDSVKTFYHLVEEFKAEMENK